MVQFETMEEALSSFMRSPVGWSFKVLSKKDFKIDWLLSISYATK